jgi:hypothetical protein
MRRAHAVVFVRRCPRSGGTRAEARQGKHPFGATIDMRGKKD